MYVDSRREVCRVDFTRLVLPPIFSHLFKIPNRQNPFRYMHMYVSVIRVASVLIFLSLCLCRYPFVGLVFWALFFAELPCKVAFDSRFRRRSRGAFSCDPWIFVCHEGVDEFRLDSKGEAVIGSSGTTCVSSFANSSLDLSSLVIILLLFSCCSRDLRVSLAFVFVFVFVSIERSCCGNRVVSVQAQRPVCRRWSLPEPRSLSLVVISFVVDCIVPVFASMQVQRPVQMR